MLVYGDVIAPLLESRCANCHNTRRAKGDLSLATYNDLLGSGKSGMPTLTRGIPEQSELYNRVALLEGHEDRMPPEGKAGLRDDELELLKYWIMDGASDELTISEIQQSPIGRVVENLVPELAKYRRKRYEAGVKMQQLEHEMMVLADKLSVIIARDSSMEGAYFAIAMKFPPAPFTNDQFRELSPYAEYFSKLSLISSGIDDDGLYYIGQMENLRSLYLQKTRLDGSGLVHLQKLSHLETLNLSFTGIDDHAVLDLLKVPDLREVYLYRTNTSKAVVEAMAKNKPGLRLLLEEGPYF
jgi:hypothetical protein